MINKIVAKFYWWAVGWGVRANSLWNNKSGSLGPNVKYFQLDEILLRDLFHQKRNIFRSEIHMLFCDGITK